MQLTRALKQSFRIRPSLGLAPPFAHLRFTLPSGRFKSFSSSDSAPVQTGIEGSPTTKSMKETSEGPTPIDKTSTNQPLTSHATSLPSSLQPPAPPGITQTSKDSQTEEGAQGKGKRTIAERDAEMMQKLLDRDGGQSTLSTEDGAWTGLKTHVKNNMFRVI
ncbi:hypothetical protein [Phaffia rhodozyma]|uniref:Uncharacterized protein n=1 Tax=Phaffia rhodozyma TaxID=264483 RepID=A0A0F7SLI3_PHARH|nr:hypothetical protein [Phaffia rhodozyma]